MVADELDQERIAACGFCELAELVIVDVDAATAEGAGERSTHLWQRGAVEVVPLRPTQEGGNALVEQIGDSSGEACHSQTDGQSVSNEVLNDGGQFGEFGAVDGMDFVDAEEQAGVLFDQALA